VKGLLLAGGHGTRLRPLTFTGNKHTLPIANKPMILYGLEQLRNAGVREVGVVLGPIKEGLIEILGDGSGLGVEITYIDQSEPKGLAHAVMVSRAFLADEPFVMYLGDNLLKQDVRQFVDLFHRENADCVIGTTKVGDPSRFGIIEFNLDGSIKRLVEKPKEPLSPWALVGVYLFNNKILDAVKNIQPSWRGEYEITDAIQALLTAGASVKVHKIEGWWKDAGRPEDLLEANQLVLNELVPRNLGTVEGRGSSVATNTSIGRGTVIHGRTTMRGPTIIGDNCEVGPNVYIGPYTSIGNNVTIRNAEIENSIVMDGTEIDCGRRIIDSLIGRKVTIRSYEQNVPKGYRLFLGDMAYVSI